MAQGWTEVFKEVGIALGLDILMKELSKKGAREGSRIIVKKLTDEHRAEVLVFIVRELAQADQIAADNLLRRQKMRQFCEGKYQPGDEDKYVTLLAKLYLTLDGTDGSGKEKADGQKERDSRLQIFRWLGGISDPDFDAALEFLNHDVFIQWLKKSWSWLAEISKYIYSNNRKNLGLVQKMDKELAPTARSLRNFKRDFVKQTGFAYKKSPKPFNLKKWFRLFKKEKECI
ncbi:MAG: hypothetical protein AAB772_00225 [Patescibacteria group bacterium]